MSYIFWDKIQQREYQVNIAKASYHHNTLIVLPTGLGKTIIGLMIVDHDLSVLPGAKALMLAPTKPLVLQHMKTFSELSSLRGGVVDGEVNSEKRKAIYENSDIIFGTPQTVINDIRNNLVDLSKFSTAIFDEAHHAIGNYPYVSIARDFVTRSFYKHTIGLTASPPPEREKALEICRNLFIDRIEIRTEDDEDVSPYIFQKQFIRIKIPMPPEIQEITTNLKKIIEREKEELINSGFTDLSKSKLTNKEILSLREKLIQEVKAKNYSAFKGIIIIGKILKLNHLEYIISTQTVEAAKSFIERMQASRSRVDRELLKDQEFKEIIEKILDISNKKVENGKLEKLKEIVSAYKGNKIIIFAQYRDTVNSIYEYLKTNVPEVKASIFIGHGKGGMTQKEQKKIIEEFERGEIEVLISTSVSEEGISIKGADIAIFYEPVPSAIRTIQRKGRVGRFNIGKIYVLTVEGSKDDGYFWVSNKREKQIKILIQSLNEELSKNASLRQYF